MKRRSRGQWTSASNALADRLCRGRHQAQRNLPELPSTPESEAGLVIHALWTGKKPLRKPTADEMEKARALLEQEELVAEEFFGTEQRQELVRMVERRLWHQFASSSGNWALGTLKTSGQFDVVLFHPRTRRALICDGKTGWAPVSPNSTNPQLRRLAALLWLRLDPAEVGVCILRPFERSEPICLYARSDLKQSVRELEEDVRQTHRPNAPRTPGEEQCRYCRAREVCPKRLSWLSAALPQALSPLPLISARQWTPAQRALFLDREKDARDWLEARKAEIKELLSEAPGAVPGYYLRQGRRIESITNSEEVFKRFCQILGAPLQSFMRCVKVGKSALKQELRILSGHQGKTLDADLDALLRGCVERKRTAPAIERLKGPPRLKVSGPAQPSVRRQKQSRLAQQLRFPKSQNADVKMAGPSQPESAQSTR